MRVASAWTGLAVLAASSMANPTYASVIRVDPNGTGDATSVSDAMALASAGDTVAVIAGILPTTNVEMVDGVQLLGGWDSAFSTRVPGTTHLVSNGAHVLQCTTGQGLATLVDGFEISGALASAFLLTSSSATIRNNEFHDNAGIDGAAIHCEEGASPLIEGNAFRYNRAESGGAIRAHWGSGNSPEIRANLIEYNEGSVRGGGICVNNGSPVIEDNVIRFNTGGRLGGGINVWHAGGGTVEIRRNLVIFNSADRGGGIGIDGGHPIIESNTVWANAADEGGALSQEESIFPDPGTTYVSNNILGGSVSGDGVFCVQDLDIVLDCNDVYGNAGPAYQGCPPGPTDIQLDPQFCDATDEDFTLRSSSPCAPPGVTGCGLIGAFGVACGPISVEPETWGGIKVRYR